MINCRLSAFYRGLTQDLSLASLFAISSVILCFFPSFAKAITSSDSVANVSLTQANFLSPDYNLTQKKDFQFIGAGINTVNPEAADGLQAEVNGLVAPSTTVLSYLNVKQLFWQQESLSIGRKKETWSYLDSNYTLGLYQPLFQWDPLLPEEQGMTGVYLRLDSPDASVPWGFVAFASPFFIPDQGAGYQIRDGQFQQSNPYFQAPPKFFVIQGQTDTADYNIQKPDTNSVVFNRSFAGKLYFGKEQDGLYFQTSYANKPVNQLALGFQGFVKANDNVNVQIQPQVYNHTLTSADLVYSWKNASLGMSALHEEMSSPTYDPQWTYASFSTSDLLSPFVKVRLKNFETTLSYLSVQGASATVQGDLADQAANYLPQRYPFRNAYQALVNYRFRVVGSRYVSLKTRYLQGSQNEFALWTTQVGYQFQSRWSMRLTTQLVDVKDNAAGNLIAYQAYNNNDAIAMGVSYVF